MSSLAEQLAKLPISDLADITDEHAAALLYDWDVWARDKQKEPPGNWRVWLIMAGRGFGKTKTGAEWTRSQLETGKYGRMALVGRTTADVRDVMVEGESGILACCPPWCRPKYEPSKRRLVWPNGAQATTYSAEEPDMLRGPQHDSFWGDEIATWCQDAFDQLMFGLRLGTNPRGIATTTPRPTKMIKDLMQLPTTYVTRGSTYENRSNLAEAFFDQVIRKFENTRLGRQELLAEILEDNPGALWKRDWIEDTRVIHHPELKRIIVAIDPPGSSSKTSEEPAEAGIVVAGLGMDGRGYVIADHSLTGTPNEWAAAALSAYSVFEADCIVAETNFGGEMVEAVIQGVANSNGMGYAPFRAVHASRGKQLRAEPISNLYQQGRVSHVGTFPDLEDQMTNWLPGEKSPDRLDALVWCLTELMIIGAIPLSGNDAYEEDTSDSLQIVVPSLNDPFAWASQHGWGDD
jgi:phage terminase large subunit-like protein